MKHIVHISQKPVRSGVSSIPDGAICGNGDLAVILGNSPDGMRIYLSKCDLWEGVERYDAGGVKPLGFIDIPIADDLYSQYSVEQDMDKVELRCRFVLNGRHCAFTVTVFKTENAVCIRNTGNVPLQPVLHVFEGETTGRKGEFAQDGVQGIFRSFDDEGCLFETHVFAALKAVDTNTFYCFTATNHDTDDPKSAVMRQMQAADTARVRSLLAAHDAAWQAFWAKSSFSCADETLENAWYASQYYLAISAGNPQFPPGIFANFITVEHPSWHGDYHLNYNYQAPFYAACSSNHVELTDGYMTPLEQFMERGAEFAGKFGCRGILMPVAIAPKGVCTEMQHGHPYMFERLFLGQKNNQLHPADIAVFRWRATRDEAYAREHAYPYLKACLQFFADYGIWEPDGRFSVCKDSAHEVPIYRDDFTPEKYKKVLNDKNNVLTLGLLQMGLDAAVDMAQTLGIDAQEVETWRHMRAHLSPFPTCRRWGQKVYRYTEKGQRWNETGDVGLQHVYPAGCIGLSSDPEALKLARATFRQKMRYCFIDDNAVSSFFPMAARLGIRPQIILHMLRRTMRKKLLPNMLFGFAGGCLENCSIAATTLNEMALQSHQGVVRLFPCWDRTLDCAFRDLRADGAFLVSSSMRGGQVGETSITAEKGGTLQVVLPYSGASVRLGDTVQTVSGNTFTLETKAGDVVIVTRAE